MENITFYILSQFGLLHLKFWEFMYVYPNVEIYELSLFMNKLI